MTEPALTTALHDIRRSIEGIHRRIDRHAERQEKDLTEVKAKLDETNGRLRALELWKERIIGAVSAAGLSRPLLFGAAGAVFAVLAERFL